MVRIFNLQNNNNIVSFDYYCENQESERGYVSFNLKTNNIVESILAPMEANVGHELYQTVAIGYARRMLEEKITDKVFCWY